MIASITTTIKEYLESFSFEFGRHVPSELPFDVIYENGKDNLFDFTFPWYADLDTDVGKQTLEDFKRMFILRFYTERIKAETIGLFKIRLNSRLTEEMPRFKQLYDTTMIDYDPLINQLYIDRTHDNLKGSATENFNSDTEAEENYRLLSSVDENGNSNRDTSSHRQDNRQDVTSDNPQVSYGTGDYASGILNVDDTEDISGDESINTNTNREQDDRSDRENTSTREDLRKNEKEDDRNVRTNREGFVGSSMTDNIEKYRESILNLNKWLCDICDGVYPAKLYDGVGETRHSSLFGGYIGKGITKSIGGYGCGWYW